MLKLPEEFKVSLSQFGEDYVRMFIDKVLDDNDFAYHADKDRFYDPRRTTARFITVREDGIRLGYDMVMYENCELPAITASEYLVVVKAEEIGETLPKSSATVDLVFVRQYIEDEFGAKERERFDHALKWRG